MMGAGKVKSWAEATRAQINGDTSFELVRDSSPVPMSIEDLVWKVVELFDYEWIKIYDAQGRIIFAGKKGDPPEKWHRRKYTEDQPSLL